RLERRARLARLEPEKLHRLLQPRHSEANRHGLVDRHEAKLKLARARKIALLTHELPQRDALASGDVRERVDAAVRSENEAHEKLACRADVDPKAARTLAKHGREEREIPRSVLQRDDVRMRRELEDEARRERHR